MAIITLIELKQHQKPGQRLLGLDIGDKRIGVAVSDASWTIANPYSLIQRKSLKHVVQDLQKIIQELVVGAIVVGYPINMDGSQGPRTQATIDYIKALAQHITVPFVLQDERLSTEAVTRTMLAADLSRKRQAEVVDKMAAAYILQGVLDRIKTTDI